jgi:hypothetical protein
MRRVVQAANLLLTLLPPLFRQAETVGTIAAPMTCSNLVSALPKMKNPAISACMRTPAAMRKRESESSLLLIRLPRSGLPSRGGWWTSRCPLTAATAGSLALLGAVLGTAGAYLGFVAWSALDSDRLLPGPPSRGTYGPSGVVMPPEGYDLVPRASDHMAFLRGVNRRAFREIELPVKRSLGSRRPMPRQNRVDPWGDLHAVTARGMFTGNRGCLVNDVGDIVRHCRGSLWITCLTRFRDWQHPLAEPGRWTPLFFLDDAVALAAGHRPCGLCRRDEYLGYRDAVTAAMASDTPLLAMELNRRLASERHQRGRGLVRANDRRLWTTDINLLPAGVIIVDDQSRPCLLLENHRQRFSFEGWQAPEERPRAAMVSVLTPPTSVAALGHGFSPVLHPTAYTKGRAGG